MKKKLLLLENNGSYDKGGEGYRENCEAKPHVNKSKRSLEFDSKVK
jgi:hypothetical protein